MKTADLENYIYVDDPEMPELAPFWEKREVQLLRMNEPAPGVFVCETVKVIGRALDAGYEPISVLTSLKNPDAEAMAVLIRCGDVPVYYMDDSILREMSGYALTGGILALMKRKAGADARDVLAKKRLIAVLENVQNPTNVGAIFRSAAAMGVEAVLLTSDTSDPLYRRAARVSVGNVFLLPWARVDKDSDYLALLKELGYASVAMALSENAVGIRDPEIKKKEKLAVILGSEGYGLREDTIRRSDFVAKIPMNPAVDSLNVAAASAVMFWELSRDRL